jgi:H+/Cl- antiporter ClcA
MAAAFDDLRRRTAGWVGRGATAAVRRAAGIVAEQRTLLGSLAKWTVLSTLVGTMVGASTTLFLLALDWTTAAVGRAPGGIWLLPLGLCAASLLVRLLAPEAEGHGTERVIAAVHQRWGRIDLRVAPVKLAATVVTIATGGSVGKEGPCAQIGASLASALAHLLRLGLRDRRTIVVCGISAGFATVFGTPIAGSIFGIEVLSLGALFYDVLYPSFIAGIVGYQVSSALGVRYFHAALFTIPRATQGIFLRTVVAGILFGLIALLLIESLRAAHDLARRVSLPQPVLALGGGAALAVISLATGPRYLGLGLDTIDAAVRGVPIPVLAFAWKILFTATALSIGGSGGIVTPIFFIGATAGSGLGALLGVDAGTLAAIGMAATLAAAANTPVAAAVLAIEFFGPAVGPFAAIASVVAFLIVGHRSVYPSQILGVAKAARFQVTPGVALAGQGEIRIRTLRLRRLRLLARAARRKRRRPDPGSAD